jgi:aminoglycoside/choline kinase family phosphotransferase
MSERGPQLDAFLARCGLAAAVRAPIPGDASFRRYLRVADGAGRYIVMDAPPPVEDVRPFLRVARHLRALGLSAPLIHAADEDRGFLLLEDLGDATFTRVLAAGGAEAPLYDLALDALIALQTHPDATRIDVPAQDAAMLADDGAALFVDWYLPEVTGRATSPDLRAAYLALWHDALTPALALPPTLALRDFHVDNLMVLDGRRGAARCGLLDFQDAAIGSPAYDLISLLEDARRDVSPAVVAAMRARHRAALPHLPGDELARACAVLAAARHARIAGLWIRLWRRDGKPGYLAFLPRTWRLLETALRHPALDALRVWFDRHAPAELRRVAREGER